MMQPARLLQAMFRLCKCPQELTSHSDYVPVLLSPAASSLIIKFYRAGQSEGSSVVCRHALAIFSSQALPAQISAPLQNQHAYYSDSKQITSWNHGPNHQLHGHQHRLYHSSPDTLHPQQPQQHKKRQGTHTHSSSRTDSSTASLRHKLLECALAEVKEHGWGNTALESAARKQGLSPALSGILSRREGDLVEFFIARCNQHLLRELQAMHQDGRLALLGSTRARLAVALKLRLEMLEPYIDSWPQALSIAIQPRNAPSCLRLLGQMVDDVWAVAGGDKSTDYNYFTKRGLLAGVYTSTELFMLTDYSPGFSDTWQALYRRLDDVVEIGKKAGSLKHAFSALNQAATGSQAQTRHPSHPEASTEPESPEAGTKVQDEAGKQATAQQ